MTPHRTGLWDCSRLGAEVLPGHAFLSPHGRGQNLFPEVVTMKLMLHAFIGKCLGFLEREAGAGWKKLCAINSLANKWMSPLC